MASRNGSVFNPNLISVYTGTDLRAFQFSFSCVIENRKDWVNYMEMYNSLKYISAGVLAGSNSAYINTPSAVSFRFFKYNQGDTGTRVKDYDYIFRSNTYQKEDPSRKSSLRNYSLFFIKKVESDLGNDAMNVYFDGAPKIASIKISIEERKPRYDKDWK